MLSICHLIIIYTRVMVRIVLVALMLVLALSKSSSTLLVLSSNSEIHRLLTLGDMIDTIKNQQVPYYYFDISTSASSNVYKAKIRELIRQMPPGYIKHSSMIDGEQQKRLEEHMIHFDKSNTYTSENLTQLANQTSKIQIDDTLLSPAILKNVDLRSLVILRVHAEGVRLLQQVSQVDSSEMLSVMTPSALSGLLVSAFLLVVLLIAVSCLMDLKTNDRFPRTLLHVGRQS